LAFKHDAIAPARTRLAPEPARPGRPRWPIWLPWPLAALTWSITVALAALITHAAFVHPPHMGDLAVYRTAGRQVLDGKQVYARVPPRELASLGRSYLVFTYPPFAAILAVPLALVGWDVARLAWVPVVYLPLVVTVWFAFRPLLARTGRYSLAALGAITGVCMFLWPMLQEIRFGQVDIALAALCVADLAATGPRWPRGLLIGLATAIKLTPGLLIVYLLLTGRRKAACVSAVTSGCCALIAWALLPGGSAYYWTNALFNTARLGRPGQTSDQSIRAMLLRAYTPASAPTALWLGLAACVAVAGFAAALIAARHGNDMAGVAIVGFLAVLISPVSWIHHIVWIVVAIGAILSDGRGTRCWLMAIGATEFFTFADPYVTRTPWFAVYAPHLFEELRQDAFGICCAALVVVLATLPRTLTRAAPDAPVPAGQRNTPPLAPAIGPDRSTAPDASAPAAPRPPAPRARPPARR
jgi:alpha-1,2-mannosyltransferase